MPRLKPEKDSATSPLGLKAELPRMNAGAPTIAHDGNFRALQAVLWDSMRCLRFIACPYR